MADEFKHLSAGTSLTQGEYEAVGGHVLACQATGDIVYASSGSQLSRLGKGAANTILAMGGSCIPAWTASPSVTDLTIGGGCITLSAATDIDLLDNNASALSFDASGKTGIIDIVTTNCSEGVTMSGTLGVTGVVTASAEIELGHASDTTLARASSGEVNIEGNRIYRAGGTDVALADGGTGASLSDPGADRLLFWDDGSCAVAFLTAGSGLTICGTTMTASGGSITALNSNADNRIAFFGSTTTELDGDADLTWDGNTLIVRGEAGAPATSGSSVNATARFNPTGVTGTVDFGFLADSCGRGWIQSTCTGNHATNYILALNKNGGTIEAGGVIRGVDGSAAAPSLSFLCDTDLGFYRHGTNAISFTGGAQQGLTFSDPGVIYARDTANGNMSIGLTLNQQATDNDIFSLKSTDVAHGATNVSETDTYMAMGKAEGTAGGLDMRVFSDAQGNSDSRSFMLRTMVTGGSTTKTTSARAPFWVYAAGISGTCDADLGSDENLMVISNRGNTRFIFDVEGTAHADVGTATFDDYCDVELLRGLLGQTVDGYKENYRNRFGKDLMYNLPFYEENKLIGKDSIHWEQRDCGKWEQRAMINTTGLTMLHHSTIIQLADRVDARLTALENQIALQGGK